MNTKCVGYPEFECSTVPNYDRHNSDYTHLIIACRVQREDQTCTRTLASPENC